MYACSVDVHVRLAQRLARDAHLAAGAFDHDSLLELQVWKQFFPATSSWLQLHEDARWPSGYIGQQMSGWDDVHF